MFFSGIPLQGVVKHLIIINVLMFAGSYVILGEEVFNSAQQNTLLWDGNYKGSEQPRDVYLWFVRYTDAQGVERTINGDMVLIR
jgi:hypothetical protein